MAAMEESKPPSLSALARGNDMIVVDVGPDHQKYRIYKELISYYSEYFRNALKEPWKEAKDRVVELPDIEPQVFDVFVDWLYSQKVPEKNRHWVAPTDDIKSNSTEHVQLAEILVIKTYVFADRFLVPTLRCAIYNHFAASLTKDCIPPYYEVIIHAFDNLTEKSAMLELLVGLHCAFWDESCDTESNGELELRKELPVEFLLRVMIRSSKMKDKEKAKSLVECGCHKEKAKEREGCESCRPEEKVEEPKEDEAQADGEAQDNDAAQANDGAAADADQDAEGADDEAQEDDEVAADGTPEDDTVQVGDGAQPNEAEGAGEGTSANGGEPVGGAPQADSELQPNDEGQASAGERANEPVQISESAEGGATQVDGEERAEDPIQANDLAQSHRAVPRVGPVQASEEGAEGAGATQISDVPVEIASVAPQVDAVAQGEAVAPGDRAGQSNHEAAVLESSQLNEETRTSAANAPVLVA